MLPDLVEFAPCRVSPLSLSLEAGQRLWVDYGELLDIAFPSPRTNWEWELRSRGVVGYIPVGDSGILQVHPRAPIRAIFRMWEVAYDIEPKWLPQIVGVQSLQDFYSWLASHLAAQTLQRARRGLYREYVKTTDLLPYVRGRIDLRRMTGRPWQVQLRCSFEDHTADIEENRLIAAALRVAADSAACSSAALRSVRHAYWRLQQASVVHEPLPAARCLSRNYNRLNLDYQPMHALCHFILSQTGPTDHAGTRRVRAFTIQMPRLFERFVHRWLENHLPMSVMLDAQRTIAFGTHVRFIPDLVIRSRRDGKAMLVIDTKYKVSALPDEMDVAQVVAYATGLGCSEAVLLYPSEQHTPIETVIGGVRVRTLAFPLNDDVDADGLSLLARLLPESTMTG